MRNRKDSLVQVKEPLRIKIAKTRVADLLKIPRTAIYHVI